MGLGSHVIPFRVMALRVLIKTFLMRLDLTCHFGYDLVCAASPEGKESYRSYLGRRFMHVISHVEKYYIRKGGRTDSDVTLYNWLNKVASFPGLIFWLYPYNYASKLRKSMRKSMYMKSGLWNKHFWILFRALLYFLYYFIIKLSQCEIYLLCGFYLFIYFAFVIWDIAGTWIFKYYILKIQICFQKW